MTEREKIHSGNIYFPNGEEILEEQLAYLDLMDEYNRTSRLQFEKRTALLKQLFAEVGEELLNTMLSMDEGAAYLGECALVPQKSPISESGLLFYNTLFDENAACHLAVGMGFADTIRDHHSKTLEECRALGINDSMIHEDFMIGCDSMNIDAKTADGKIVPIFRNGNWAF